MCVHCLEGIVALNLEALEADGEHGIDTANSACGVLVSGGPNKEHLLRGADIAAMIASYLHAKANPTQMGTEANERQRDMVREAEKQTIGPAFAKLGDRKMVDELLASSLPDNAKASAVPTKGMEMLLRRVEQWVEKARALPQAKRRAMLKSAFDMPDGMEKAVEAGLQVSALLIVERELAGGRS